VAPELDVAPPLELGAPLPVLGPGEVVPPLTCPDPMPPLVEFEAPGDVVASLELPPPGAVELGPVDGMVPVPVPPGDAAGLLTRACASRLHASKSAWVGVAAETGPDTASRPAAVIVAIA
jgi:hypothetical protein